MTRPGPYDPTVKKATAETFWNSTDAFKQVDTIHEMAAVTGMASTLLYEQYAGSKWAELPGEMRGDLRTYLTACKELDAETPTQ